ncbi:MAG: 3-dehydroquinate synthase [Chloroflexia bacterium]|nr:3-dehydroquinate synthase [Chloroflexia bacterium]
MGVENLPRRVVLIGPSGSGKSEVAGRLAAALGYRAIDTDAMVEDRAGMPVFEFFARFGEPAFRAIETEMLREACSSSGTVIATGGGIVLKPENWTAFRPESAVIALTAAPETLASRIERQLCEGRTQAVRPLLAGDPVARLRQLVALRGPLYAQADCVVETDDLSADEVQESVLRYLRQQAGSGTIPRYSLPTAIERSDIYIGHGISTEAARLARRRWPRAQRVWLVTDENVMPHWGRSIGQVFEVGGFSVNQLIVPAGESSKSFERVEHLCGEMTSGGVTRRDLVVALGGGVVGDLAGFVASVCLRGLSLIQMPTSLLAMVDSSVGGKTAINTGAGKNQVGAFYQPGLVLIDPNFLHTLPAEELESGMAEVIKHSVIQPTTPLGGSSLAHLLESLPSLRSIPAETLTEALSLNVGIKYSVVLADERESGLRMILNFGHTAGQAIEADGYRYRHGEAVALGMLVASRIALHLERVDGRWVERLEQLLSAAGLPTRFEGKAASVLDLMSHDKKNIDGSLHWILPAPDGGVESVTGVDTDMVRLALLDVGAA